MNFPKVTVIIPNHNDENYIVGAIKSAALQTYIGPLQICVIDDASKDNSWNIICSLIEQDASTSIQKSNDLEVLQGIYKGKSLTAIRRPEAGGPSAARNTGINLTLDQTEIYAMLDSDDEFYKDKVSKCVSLMIKDFYNIGAVYADYDTINVETNKTIREFKEPFSRRRLVEECIVHSGSVVNKLALEKVAEDTGYYDETMRTCEDYDLWMRISEYFIMAHIPESLTLVRVTGDNSSFIVNQEVWQKNWTRVREKFYQRNHDFQ